ncbi:septum formation protein [Monoraphidium neglectum]|uniref:Septum formation protein n=1 Tax=Monoraphidium neglectum TaxID=145388 RepID=A0A0D2MUC4_9CHLO|nr:septum formation protein [Monoraphidium neglectum]KIZ04112.1 septum formation protein [Monoraphidium neglectum]|eukprot:XP_013903131.1 septum formation protein [Monoraphidium neglectum]
MDQLAQAFGFSYDVRKADIDEKAIRHDEPAQLVMALAHAKADAILTLLRSEAAAAGPGDRPGAGAGASADDSVAEASTSGGGGAAAAGGAAARPSFLITCDQVVVHEGLILEKPEDADQARAFIRGYARSPAQTVGSVLCTRLGGGSAGGGGGGDVRIGTVENCTILMDPLPEEAAEKLIEEGEVLWCAGGLMVEHPLVRPHVRGIEGGGEDSVMGLGREAVMRVLVEAAEAGADAP